MFILLYCFPDFPGLQNYTELWVLLKYIPRGVMDWMSFPQNSYVVVCCSVTNSYPTFCDLMDCSTPGFPVLHHLPEFAETHIHWVDDVIQPSHPLPFSFPSIRVLSNESALCTRSFSFSISLSNENSGLISFRIDWFDLLSRVFSKPQCDFIWRWGL